MNGKDFRDPDMQRAWADVVAAEAAELAAKLDDGKPRESMARAVGRKVVDALVEAFLVLAILALWWPLWLLGLVGAVVAVTLHEEHMNERCAEVMGSDKRVEWDGGDVCLLPVKVSGL